MLPKRFTTRVLGAGSQNQHFISDATQVPLPLTQIPAPPNGSNVLESPHFVKLRSTKRHQKESLRGFPNTKITGSNRTRRTYQLHLPYRHRILRLDSKSMLCSRSWGFFCVKFFTPSKHKAAVPDFEGASNAQAKAEDEPGHMPIEWSIWLACLPCPT